MRKQWDEEAAWAFGNNFLVCAPSPLVKVSPTVINKKHLATPCLISWSIANSLLPNQQYKRHQEIFLQVERATIFFTSERYNALLALNTTVIRQRTIPAHLVHSQKCPPYFTINQTPAATKVEEWTKDLTGVGARIASKSHLLKGIVALLLKKIRRTGKKNSLPSRGRLKIQPEATKKNPTSPKREEMRVTLAARQVSNLP